MLLGESANHQLLISRLDPVDGLELANQAESKMIIDKMVICIAPGSERKWQWQDIFVGIKRQVESQQLVINELFFISSTRVFDGIRRGTVDANTLPIASTSRADTLLEAESQVKQLSSNVSIIRCCGLIGEGYTRYSEILKEPSEKVRFAVNTKQVARQVVKHLLEVNSGSRYSLLTDGYCYYKGNQIPFELALSLAEEHRLLKNSEFSVNIKKPE